MIFDSSKELFSFIEKLYWNLESVFPIPQAKSIMGTSKPLKDQSSGGFG